MSIKYLRLGILSFIISLLLCCVSSCTPDPTSTPTQPQSSPTTVQPTDYRIRIELTSTSDWANLNILNPEHILSVDLESVSGNPSFYDITAASLVVDQSISAAENGGSVGITVDYVIDPIANEQPLDIQLQRGSLNGCTARIFRLVGEDYQLVLEVENQGEIGTDVQNTLDFSLDLTAMAAIPATSEPPDTPQPGETANIIFYNGQVVTIDENMTQAEALAIKGDQILAVGSDSAVLAYQGANTIMIDLQGKTLMPGFADGHNHFFQQGNRPGSLDEAQNFALMHGYTSMTEMAGDDFYLQEMLDAEEAGELRLRVNVFPMYNFGVLTDEGEVWYAWQWYPENEPILDHDHMLRIPGIKVFVDGAGIAPRGCFAMSEPYSAEQQAADWFKSACFNEYGDLYWEQAELNQIVADAQAAGFRVAFHANGDRAIESTLDAIEYALDGQPNDDYRHQIQHSLFIRDDDMLDRYVSLDVLTSIRGHFHSCTSYGYDWEMLTNKYELPGLGVHAFLETDFNWQRTTYRTLDPFVNMFSLVTRKQIEENGNICDPPPGVSINVITIEQALRIMTIEPAYAVSQEDYLGSLEPGKFTDIVILAFNPLTLHPDDLMDNEVLMTMVGGVTEYCASGYEDICP